MSGHVLFSKSDNLNGHLPLKISQNPDHHRGISTPRLAMSEGKVTEEPSGQTITKFKPKTQKPRLYKVILLNDDFTPMDFVILILKKFFRKSDGDATRIMLQVHNSGAGLAGVFPFELAETKVYQVNEFARSQRHPLKCTMEQQED